MEAEELKNLLRECVMRAHFALPENEQDAEWFDDGRMDSDFIEQIFRVLDLGNPDKHLPAE